MWSKLWIDIFVLMMFLRKEDFPCPFFLPSKKPGRQVCTMLGLSGESRGRRVFSRGVADATLVGWRTCFTLFSELSTGTSCRVKIWRAVSWPPARMAALWTSSVSRDPVLFSGENDDRQGTPLLWPGTQEASICLAKKRRATRIGTPSRRLVKMFHPQRSDKSPGSDGSSGTNFVNLKKKLFLSKLFLRTVFKFKCWHLIPILKRIDAYWWVTGSFYQLNLSLDKKFYHHFRCCHVL